MTLLLDPGARPVVAHRGNSAHAPENTLEALEQGVSMGAEGATRSRWSSLGPTVVPKIVGGSAATRKTS